MPETPMKNEAEELKEDDLNVTIASAKSKLVRKQQEPKKEVDEDDDEDDIPLSVAKAGKKNPTPTSASKTKKEEIESEEEAKPKKTQTQQAKSNVKPSRVKKEEPEDSEFSEVEEMGKKKKKKVQQKKKEEGKKVIRKVKHELESKDKVKKGRKVYDLPGQRHDPPEERDPVRIFYESLYLQMPTSEMAAFWLIVNVGGHCDNVDVLAHLKKLVCSQCPSSYMTSHKLMEWGLLPAGEAKKVFERKQMKNPSQKLRSPAKVVSVKKTTDLSVKTVKKTITVTVTKTSSKKRKASDSEGDDEDADFVLSKSKKRKFSA